MAPSGRELSPQATEGECIYTATCISGATLTPSDSLARATSLPEGGLSADVLILPHQVGIIYIYIVNNWILYLQPFVNEHFTITTTN